MAVGVTGATGRVGSAVIHHLLSRADPPPVIALARRPDAVAAKAGLTVRRADYDDPPSLREAMAGVGRLVFVASDGDGEPMRRHHEQVIAAAAAAGVGHVVYTSIVDVAPDSGFYYAAIHRETEALFAESGLDHCLARTSIFADFFLETWIEPALEQGELALPAGGGRMSLVTRADVARAVAEAALARREGVLELTGPAALTAVEIAEAFEAASGRPLRYLDLDEPDYRGRLAAAAEPGVADRGLQQHVRVGPRRPVRGCLAGCRATDRRSGDGVRRVPRRQRDQRFSSISTNTVSPSEALTTSCSVPAAPR